jgi:hypothetical protein
MDVTDRVIVNGGTFGRADGTAGPMAVDSGGGGDPGPVGTIQAGISLPGTLQAAEPGAPLSAQVSGYCNTYNDGEITKIELVVDDGHGAAFTYPAQFPASGNGTWTCTPPVFRPGQTTFTVRLTGFYYQGERKPLNPGSFDAASAAGTVQLISQQPGLSIDQQPPAQIEVPAGGTTVQVRALTNPQYQSRNVTWSLNGGPEHATRRDTSDSSGWRWVADVPVPDYPLGDNTVTMRARQVVGGAAAARNATFRTIDVTPPKVTILHPAVEQALVMPAAGTLDVVVSGTASDGQSGLDPATVGWATGTPSASYPPLTTSDRWANWASTVRITQTGVYSFQVQAADQAGNRVVATRNISVVSNYVPSSLGERLNYRAYLDALLRFAHDRLIGRTGGSTPAVDVTARLLGDLLLQPFEQLTQPAAGAVDAGDEEVNQVRVVAEILQRAIAQGIDPRSDPQNLDTRLAAHWTLNASTSGVRNGSTYLRDVQHGTPLTFATAPQLSSGVHDEGLNLGSREMPAPGGLAVSAPVSGDKDFTVTFWLNAAGIFQESTGGGILHQGDNANDSTLSIAMLRGERRLAVTVTTTAGGAGRLFSATSTRTMPQNTWVHVGVVRQGSALRIYLDGVLDSVSTLDGPLAGKSTNLYVGTNPWRGGAAAVMDDLRIYTVGLGQAELADLAAPTPYRALGAAYLQAAYDALLAGFGTSSATLRLARGDNDAARAALAGRLGIPAIYGSDEVDTLDALTLDRSTLTGGPLQALFGLRDTAATAANPLIPLAEPQLLTWQRAYLREQWLRQDHAAPPGEAVPNRLFPVLIDPDLIGLADLAATPLNDTAAALWQARRAEVDGFLRDLDNVYHSDGHDNSQSATFQALVDSTWPGDGSGPGIDLAGLAAARDEGTDIGPALDGLLLGADAFERLLLTRALAERAAADTTDWQDTFAILAQVRKARRYPAWRGEEAQISLSPSFFAPSAQDPVLAAWLADASARADWKHVLHLRIRQDAELVAGFRDTVAAADRSTVRQLRDALVAELAGDQPSSAFPAVAGWAGERFLVDTAASGSLTTTRVLQAIETLQTLLLLIRTRRLRADHPAALWTIQDEDTGVFDAEWAWLQRYESWRSAMLTWRYPENALLPTLLPSADPVEQDAFYGANGLLNSLRKVPKLTVTTARALAAAYVKALPLQGDMSWLLSDQITRQQLLDRRGFSKDYAKYQVLFGFAPLLIASRLQEAGEYLAALDWYRLVYAYDLPAGQRAIWNTLSGETHRAPDLTPVTGWLRHLNPHDIATGKSAGTVFAPARPNPYTRYVLLNLARCQAAFADAQFTQDTPASVAQARELYGAAAAILADTTLDALPDGAREQEFDNPARIALRNRVSAQLTKLREGRNIAGMLRTVDLPGEDNATFLLSTPPPAQPPTQYRYRPLADRARQLATLAQQLEAEYLSALEKYDAGAYRRFEADKALDLARAGVTTRALQLQEAGTAASLAQAQKDRASLQSGRYDSFISGGVTANEKKMLSGYAEAGRLKDGIAIADGAITALQAFQAGVGTIGTTFGASMAIAGAVTGAVIARTAVQGKLNDVETQIQKDTFQASHERQVNEWTLQRDVALKDEAIAGVQIQQAQTAEAVAHQEYAVASLQLDLDAATVAFLDGQFTSTELYEWMSGVLGGVYATVLAQATATARLAQEQLAFDRQEAPMAVVCVDYWSPPADLGQSQTPASAQGGPDRRGLTGAERLLADLIQLDQYAFQTDRRLLNITQTFSLAQRAPLEFQVFRDTGVLQFATPMDWFDADFPGHYARLIRRARLTVVGLIPPSQGIRATLTASGISRVVVGGDTFSEVTIRRDPESVALTAPTGASGVFDLDTQPDLRLPFEEMGVATTWELRLPKAANPFDFSALADVMLTLEYTALDSYEYQRQVVASLNAGADRSGDRPLSLRRDFPDLWYALHNPAPGSTARRLSLRLDRTDFAPNLDRLAVQQTVVYLVPANGTAAPSGVSVNLTHGTAWIDGASVSLGGASGDSRDGVISTRRNNGGNWTQIAGQDPAGEWVLEFSQADSASLFDTGALDDVLLIIGYSGSPPRWPA